MINYPLPFNNHRTGINYFQDISHFRQSDLQTWLPILQSLDVSWVTLTSPLQYAIPEYFLEALKAKNIEPVILFHGNSNQFSTKQDLQLLLESYSKWGVNYISFFEQPNQKSTWPPSEWAQENLVDRFLDLYIPIANYAVNLGLFPIFPALQPGGDYWDLVFLQSSLRGLIKRKEIDLLNRLVFGAYAFPPTESLDWGCGGPSRWTGAKPYHTPADQQDHKGLYIFEWYSSIIKAELGEKRPIFVQRTGSLLDSPKGVPTEKISTARHTNNNLELYSKFYIFPGQEPILFAPEVMAACFWLLSASKGENEATQAWFQSNREYLPVVDAIRGWLGSKKIPSHLVAPTSPDEKSISIEPQSPDPSGTHYKAIQHYLLLPSYGWGVADWDLDSVMPFIHQEKPAIGFSPMEAKHAKIVTVFEPKKGYWDKQISDFCKAGCQVQRLSVDGTIIAQ
jgi:hypothetical protein